MKYLVFNGVVFLALGYLIAGGEPKDFKANIQQSVEKVKTQVEQVVDRPRMKKVVKPIIEAEPVRKVVEKIKPVVEEIQKPVAAPPPMPKPVAVAKLEPKKAPSRTVSQKQEVDVAEVSEPVVEGVIETDEPEVKLTDAKERSQALRQMVADMERMFAEKMTQ